MGLNAPLIDAARFTGRCCDSPETSFPGVHASRRTQPDYRIIFLTFINALWVPDGDFNHRREHLMLRQSPD
jgi:hypothetical protein